MTGSKLRLRYKRLGVVCLVALGVGAVARPLLAEAAPFALVIKVVHGRMVGASVDPKLKKLARSLSALKFKSLTLKDEVRLELDIGSAGRMQLPDRHWMQVKARGATDEGKLRLEIHVEELEFVATVVIAQGATVVVRGPPFEDGTLVLVVSRPVK